MITDDRSEPQPGRIERRGPRWLDDLSRDRLRSGNLQELIDCIVRGDHQPNRSFRNAVGGHTYDADLS